MDKNLIERYKKEMLDMYKSARSIPTMATESAEQNSDSEITLPKANEQPYSSGKLIAIVTSLREIYPVANARVTVFTGNYNDMQIIDTAFTDESGRTRPFVLEAPNKQISLESGNNATPYATYNMEVKAEGYVDNVHINIPVFSGVTSLQRSNMMLLETAGADKSPQVFDESERFDL